MPTVRRLCQHARCSHAHLTNAPKLKSRLQPCCEARCSAWACACAPGAGQPCARSSAAAACMAGSMAWCRQPAGRHGPRGAAGQESCPARQRLREERVRQRVQRGARLWTHRPCARRSSACAAAAASARAASLRPAPPAEPPAALPPLPPRQPRHSCRLCRCCPTAALQVHHQLPTVPLRRLASWSRCPASLAAAPLAAAAPAACPAPPPRTSSS
jgi:hypothetical protein